VNTEGTESERNFYRKKLELKNTLIVIRKQIKMGCSCDKNGQKEDGEKDHFPRCATALTRQRIITSSAFKLGALQPTQQSAGYSVRAVSLCTCAEVASCCNKYLQPWNLRSASSSRASSCPW
jgi:hypothetical protein